MKEKNKNLTRAEKIKKLEEKIKADEALLKRLKSETYDFLNDKEKNRSKFLLGEYLLTHISKNKNNFEKIIPALDKYFVKDSDTEILNKIKKHLAGKQEQSSKQNKDQNQNKTDEISKENKSENEPEPEFEYELEPEEEPITYEKNIELVAKYAVNHRFKLIDLGCKIEKTYSGDDKYIIPAEVNLIPIFEINSNMFPDYEKTFVETLREARKKIS